MHTNVTAAAAAAATATIYNIIIAFLDQIFFRFLFDMWIKNQYVFKSGIDNKERKMKLKTQITGLKVLFIP